MTSTNRERTHLIVVPSDNPVQISQSPRLQTLRSHADVKVYTTTPAGERDQIGRVRDANVIINSRAKLRWPGNILRQLPELRMITTCSIGTDSIDLAAARELGITVSNVPGKTAPIVAEHAFALLMAVSRRLAFQTAELKAGRWTNLLATSLIGKTLGVIGTGNIGCQLIRLAKTTGMNVIAWTFHPSNEKAAEFGFEYVELDELLGRSDAVSIHVRLTKDSRNLIGGRELRLLKPGSLIVNTSRGAVIDTDSLIDALESGHLGGAALDVFDTEPLPADHRLLKCQHVILTPHNADQTPEGVDALNQGAVENVLAFLQGRPRNVVT